MAAHRKLLGFRLSKGLVIVKTVERADQLYKERSWTRKNKIPGAHCVPHEQKKLHNRAPCLVGHRMSGAFESHGKYKCWGQGREEKDRKKEGRAMGRGKKSTGPLNSGLRFFIDPR